MVKSLTKQIVFDPALLEERPTKQGFLVKHKCIRDKEWVKGVTKNWRKRWFLLIGTKMFYFKLPSDTKPKGWFELAGGKVEMAEDATGQKLCFAVHTSSNTTFLMIATSVDTLSNWLAVIRNVVSPSETPQTPRVPLTERAMVSKDLSPVTIQMKRVRFKSEIQGTPPVPRQNHSAFLIDAVRMMIFGGVDTEGSTLGDVMVFNLGTATWERYAITGDSPGSREAHSACAYNESHFFFGGRQGNALFNDLSELNLDELSWTRHFTSGSAPSPRYSHAAGILGECMYVLGGIDSDSHLLSDVFALDLSTLTWRQIEPTSAFKPSASHACAALNEVVVMFGGQTDAGIGGSLTIFNPVINEWSVDAAQGKPPSPRTNAAAAAFKNRVMFIVGGESPEGTLLSDIWALDTATLQWMQISLLGPALPLMSGAVSVIKDQICYFFGGKTGGDALSATVTVTKILDQGLPSINLPRTVRSSVVQRMQLRNPKLTDFEIGVVLGTGSFGRVHCVRHKENGKTYALKILKKKEILQLNQVDHILGERDVLSSISHPHIVNFCGSFQDSRYLYIVMEFVNGGEFFTHLRKAGKFKEETAQFYTAQVLTAFKYLHSNSIVYRDLKPENLLLDSNGHLKVTDFGFAKQVEFRTWTLCGTPEYLAPELILSKGHNKAVDYWALGILMFEMMAGYPPYFDDEPLRIYQKILKGDIKYPSHFSAESKDLMSKLLEPDAMKRLGSGKRGAEDIMEHPWFKHIDWQDISGHGLIAPIRPNVVSEGDTSNFDAYPEEDPEGQPMECSEAENAKFVAFG